MCFYNKIIFESSYTENNETISTIDSWQNNRRKGLLKNPDEKLFDPRRASLVAQDRLRARLYQQKHQRRYGRPPDKSDI